MAGGLGYGPYSELLNYTGSSSTQFLYVGEDGVITDENGLYYMRSRYYSPEIKRFISEDTFEGKYDELLNINLFEYANNNPVMNVDPEGEFVPLLMGGAYLAYRAWSAYDTYSDGKAAYYAWKRKDYKALKQSGFYFGLGLFGGKGAKYGGKFGVKVARYSKNGKYYKVAKGTRKAGNVNINLQLFGNWAKADVSISKQLAGKGQLRDLRNNPNLRKVNINELLEKTPMELEAMAKRGDIDQKTLKQIKKAFEGRDLGKRGK